ncbi:hypothetical protein BDP55DRAFT_678162 [Colletotrichum godetiae]|uniref:Uncharacterized protein n=1 Tax=Colletotrichum godetiae TaxID=1209918 RepID=A0AAJ0AE31_9PEZI|nr:uncharacterized protein BDP55DRAFT_678162 [Colletotrichum godetiae]KAK1659876.1 hypothetical protein BDP55DRAFT_678162 [Colletotrichum godetiae]
MVTASVGDKNDTMNLILRWLLGSRDGYCEIILRKLTFGTRCESKCQDASQYRRFSVRYVAFFIMAIQTVSHSSMPLLRGPQSCPSSVFLSSGNVGFGTGSKKGTAQVDARCGRCAGSGALGRGLGCGYPCITTHAVQVLNPSHSVANSHDTSSQRQSQIYQRTGRANHSQPCYRLCKEGTSPRFPPAVGRGVRCHGSRH